MDELTGRASDVKHHLAAHQDFWSRFRCLVGMGFLGAFPTSTTGNKWIIIATDYLTKYAETKALPQATALELAQCFLTRIVLRHGAPAVVVTECGTAFTAPLLQQVLG